MLSTLCTPDIAVHGLTAYVLLFLLSSSVRWFCRHEIKTEVLCTETRHRSPGRGCCLSEGGFSRFSLRIPAAYVIPTAALGEIAVRLIYKISKKSGTKKGSCCSFLRKSSIRQPVDWDVYCKTAALTYSCFMVLGLYLLFIVSQFVFFFLFVR